MTTNSECPFISLSVGSMMMTMVMKLTQHTYRKLLNENQSGRSIAELLSFISSIVRITNRLNNKQICLVGSTNL